MRKLLLLGLLFFVGCVTTDATKQFYVRSETNGYFVALDSCCSRTTTYISGPFKDPLDAEILVKQLNRDMEGHWSK